MVVPRLFCSSVSLVCFATCCSAVHAELPSPVLGNVFPAGGQAGTLFNVAVSGDALDDLLSLRCGQAAIAFQKGQNNTFRVTIPADTPAGLYDLQAVCANGLSSTRAFFVTNRNHVLESEPDDTAEDWQQLPLDVVVSGRIERGGDVDQYRFRAQGGQRVVIECWAERIDSRLRAVLELYDERGTRLAVDRGFFGIDPLISFKIPADGDYVVRLYDLVYSGSADHFYRLDIGVGPRVVFAVPAVLERGSQTPVTLYGWNLSTPSTSETNGTARHDSTVAPASQSGGFDRCLVQVVAPEAPSAAPIHLHPARIAVDGFAYYLPGADMPISLGVTDVPVFRNESENYSADAAQPVDIPCEVSGQLVRGDQRDWYSIEVKRGEVLHLEAWGERIGAPVDLDISVLDRNGAKELASFHDELANIGGKRFPSSHLDPAGRWVAPADGRYLIVIRNLIGGLAADPRRVYRLSLRREEADVHLVAVARHRDTPAGINVRRGGRELVDLLAFRHRGLNGPIRVTAQNLPPGVQCPDVWFGPGVNRAPLIVSAAESAAPFVGTLDLVGYVELGEVKLLRKVRGGTMVRGGTPNGSGRLTSEITWAVASEAPLGVTATCDRETYSQGSVIDVAIELRRRNAQHKARVKLLGVGLPELVRNRSQTIEAGQAKGFISFYLPPSLAPGRYTIAVQAETTAPWPVAADAKQQKNVSLVAFSNPISFDVHPAPFVLEIDLDAPGKVQRGQFIRLNYTARRKNGFIGKIHTTLAAPEKVFGLRARGVTFVGQTESGTLQIIANDDAPLGRQPFLRLEAVGTVEDEPVYFGGCFLELEIVQ